MFFLLCRCRWALAGGGYCKLYVSVYFFPSLARNNIDVDCLHVYHEISYIMVSFHPRLSKHAALASRHRLNFTYFHPYFLWLKNRFLLWPKPFLSDGEKVLLTKMKRREGKEKLFPYLHCVIFFCFASVRSWLNLINFYNLFGNLNIRTHLMAGRDAIPKWVLLLRLPKELRTPSFVVNQR